MTGQDRQELDRLKQENEKLRAGIGKAFDDLHNWANSSKVGGVLQVTHDLKDLLKKDD